MREQKDWGFLSSLVLAFYTCGTRDGILQEKNMQLPREWTAAAVVSSAGSQGSFAGVLEL